MAVVERALEERRRSARSARRARERTTTSAVERQAAAPAGPRRVGVGDRAADRARGCGPGRRRSVDARRSARLAARVDVEELGVGRQRADRRTRRRQLGRTPCSSASRPMSTSLLGRASRSFISGRRLCPPAMTFASAVGDERRAPRRATPPAEYSNAAGIMPGLPSPTAIARQTLLRTCRACRGGGCRAARARR